MQIDDKYISNLFFSKNNILVRTWKKKIEIPEIKEYLENRYDDSFSLRETIYRIKDGIEKHPLCPICNNPVMCTFKKGTYRNKYLKNTCGSIDCQNKYRNQHKIQGFIKKYGVDNPWRLDKCKEQIKKHNIKKYGGNSCMCDPKINRQAVETKKRLYGDGCHYKKYQQTMLKKYGVDNFWKTEKMRKQDADPEQHKKRVITTKKNFLEKTNGKYFWQSQLPESKEKVRQTCLNKYGVSCSFLLPEVREKANSIEAKQKRKETISKRTKEEWEAYHNKRYETMKKNKSFNKSSQENEIYFLLKEKFQNIIRQYKEERYPFSCDFYIPNLDLFIEYQGSHYHHSKPFNEKDEEDIKELNILKEKANNSKRKLEGKRSQYDNIIYVWTDLDIRKREIAKQNNLNWIEFFTIKELKEWLNNLDN